jgi:hypothetical protein
VQRRQSGDGNARRAAKAPAQHPARTVRAVRAQVSLQQRKLDQVELGAAAADAFEFAGNRVERVAIVAVKSRRSNAANARDTAGTNASRVPASQATSSPQVTAAGFSCSAPAV